MTFRALFIFISSFTVFLTSNQVFGQAASDVDLIKVQDFKDETFTQKRNVTFLFTKNKNAVVRYNPVSLALGGLLYFYQKFISSQIGSKCPFDVSCSAFSKQCIQKYGLIKGMSLGADRLMRCTKLASSDLKPSDFDEDKQVILDNPDNYKSSKKSKKGHPKH